MSIALISTTIELIFIYIYGRFVIFIFSKVTKISFSPYFLAVNSAVIFNVFIDVLDNGINVKFN